MANGAACATTWDRFRFDLRLPLVANYNGTKCNVSIRSIDIPGSKIAFFAPVFEGVTYRQAKPVGDYAQRFMTAIPQDSALRCFVAIAYTTTSTANWKGGVRAPCKVR